MSKFLNNPVNRTDIKNLFQRKNQTDHMQWIQGPNYKAIKKIANRKVSSFAFWIANKYF